MPHALDPNPHAGEPHLLQLFELDRAALAAEAAAGLLAPRAALSPKFLYDALGSRLFDAITELPEYYPTRTEAAIFERCRDEIAAAVHAACGPEPVMIDLGAGNCQKAAALFASLTPRRYVAVDISVDFLAAALNGLQRQHPAMAMQGLGLDFSTRLALPEGCVDGPALMFYPGSSIGNFAPDQALRLLREACDAAQGGALLIGVDLVKPASVLEPAYDDALGVTAAFNLNLLLHVNRLLGSDFDVRQWQHLAFYDPVASRIEMHLRAREALTVRWPGGTRTFATGEAVHTENSYKWRLADFTDLLREAGFARQRAWTDPQEAFGVVLGW
jgi:dimethylhistidine N-methyltransferase